MARSRPLLVVRAGLLAGYLGLAAAVRAAEVPFVSQPPVSVAAVSARSVAAGDLDHDGDLDLVSASAGDGKLAWYENTARDGSAWAAHTIDVVSSPWFVSVADVDHDGQADVLVAAPGDGSFAWYENAAGNGTVWTRRTIASGVPSPRALVAADVDGDGDLDAVAASAGDDTVAWYENTLRNGTAWTQRVISSAATGAAAVFAADVDRDGQVDVVAALRDADTLAWYENVAGNGTAWTARVATTLADGVAGVAAGDLDGDGDVDLVSASTFDGTVAWCENLDGAGASWSRHVISAAVAAATPAALADLDGDGDLDVLSASQTGDAVVWFENAAGDGSSWTPRTVSAALDLPLSLVPADIDGDGDLDVATASVLDDKIGWSRNQTLHRGACFVAREPLTTGAPAAGPLSLGDVDGDGDVDVLPQAAGSQAVSWYENLPGNGSSWSARTVAASAPVPWYVTRLADVDGDGDLDVAAFGVGSSPSAFVLFWYENAGGGTWLPHQVASASDFGWVVGLEAADIDGDGDIDLLEADQYGPFNTSWFDNLAGNGTAWLRRPGHHSPQGVAVGDVDGNGTLDFAVASTDAMFSDHLGWDSNTDGTGQGFVYQEIDSLSGVRRLTLADLDRNGALDIVSPTHWYRHVGSSWTPVGLPSAQVYQSDVRTADLDGDGDADVLVAGSGGDLVWLDNSDGAGTAWTLALLASGAPVAGVAAGDLDGDGDRDVAFSAGSTVGWLENRGGQAAVATASVVPSGVANGDLVPVLRLDLRHAGRSGDSDLELASLGLLLDQGSGVPLTTAQANALIASLRLYRDANGNGVFDPASDTLVASLPDLALSAGVQALPLTDGDPNVGVAWGSPKTFFVVAELTADASQQSPAQFRVTHLLLGASATRAEDRSSDLPLSLQCPADVASAVVGPATPVELQRFEIE